VQPRARRFRGQSPTARRAQQRRLNPPGRRTKPMDTVSFRDLAVAETDTKTLLAHATQQGIQRRYEDFLIVDVDGHHYENMSYAEIIEYIEDPVMRAQAKYQG